MAILLLTSRLLDATDADRPRRQALAGLAGFLAVWFTNPAVLVVAGVGAVLVALVLAGNGRCAVAHGSGCWSSQ